MNGSNPIARIAYLWTMAFGLLSALALMTPAAHARDVPDGWEARAENNGTTFAPAKMNPGEKLEIWVAGPQYDVPQGASAQNQLPQIRRQAGAMEGDRCQPPEMASSGVATQACMEGNVALQYMLLPSAAGAGKVRLLRIRAAGGDEVLAHYGDGFQQVLRLAMQGQAQTMPRGESQPQPQTQPETARAAGVPDGWKVYRANHGVVFAPVRMNPGETLEIWVAAEWSEKIQRGATWASQLPQIRQKAGAMGDEKCQPPKVESGMTTQTCVAGEEVAQYMLLPMGIGGNYARLLRLRVAGAGVMDRYKSGLQQAMDIVRRDNIKNVLNGQERQERARAAQAIRTPPGQGVQDGDIAAVYVTSQGGSRVEHTTWLLLKDGTGYQNEIPPDELNVRVSRQLQPERWVQWRKPWLGGDYEIRGPSDSDWRPLSKGWIAQPGRPGERLNGVYEHIDSSGSAAGYFHMETITWYFSGDGTFKASFDSHGGTTGTTFSSIAKAHADWTGSSSSSNSLTPATSNNPAAPGSVSVTAGGTRRNVDDGSSRRGRYRFKGWVLELERDDGQTERHFVTFRGDQRHTMDIGGRWFEAKKK